MKDDTDPKERFVSYKFTPSILQNGRQNYMENKDKGNEHKIILEDFNCTMDKMDRDGENKTQRPYWCCSSYALSKLIVDDELGDLWRRENPDSPELTPYNRSFGKDPG